MIAVDNKIVDNVFSDEEIAIIYEHVKNTPEDKRFYQEAFAHTAYFSWLPDQIVDKIVSVVNNNSEKKLVLKELSFARYENSRGLNPLLFPHYDESFKEQRVTFDIQLKASRPWAIVVEDTPYTLSDNQGLFFSGTHQVHWREKMDFDNGEIVDMIFCHFSEEDPETTPAEHYQSMNKKVQHFRDQYYAQ
jgi:hypothetical protein